MKNIPVLVVLLVSFCGCAVREAPNPAYYQIEQGKLPPTDVTLNIPGLGPCTDNPDRSLHLDSSKPLNVLVHGCFGSSGQFRALAQVFAFQGQQSACFTYDDRAELTESATALRQAVDQVASQTHVPLVTVIGHSQGALISRKSLTELSNLPPPSHSADLRLVTISGPFDGIESAKTCGKTWLYPVTLGLLPLTCHLVTGPKYADITFASSFILEPGMLVPQVSKYLKIDTDENNSCRKMKEGKCVKDDFVFSLAEQQNPTVESDERINHVVVRAGHVEIVGNKRVAPTKLIGVLQEQGVLNPTAAEKQSAFRMMLSRVYEESQFYQ